ncbi:MAG: hypothetical protein HYS13_02390 [Planctomycetia bacterium]|nr:hypothetical protein [Planctomycetia bacterium]
MRFLAALGMAALVLSAGCSQSPGDSSSSAGPIVDGKTIVYEVPGMH